jgi:surface protein
MGCSNSFINEYGPFLDSKESSNESDLKMSRTDFNEINIVLLIYKDESDRDDFLENDIYFLDNKVDLFEGDNNHNNLKELNSTNVDLYIDGKKTRFKKCHKFKEIGIHKIKLKFKFLMTDCSYMFYNSIYLTDVDLSSFDSSEVQNMSNMFCGCKNLKYIDLSSLNTKNLKNIGGMFGGCASLTKINLKTLNSKKLTDISGLFGGCFNLQKIDLTPLYTKNVTNMAGMFISCCNLESINVSSFETGNVTNMNNMFANCLKITN